MLFVSATVVSISRARELNERNESNESNESRMNQEAMSHRTRSKQRKKKASTDRKIFFLDRENKIPTKIPISVNTKK